MPELPEVETIKKGLKSTIVGREIKKVEVKVPKMFIGKTGDLAGAKVNSVERRAKMLLISLSNGLTLLVHLKMTGQLVFAPSTSLRASSSTLDWVKDLPSKHSHIIFYFKDGSILYFNDIRKFGYIKVYHSGAVDELKVLKELGPEPFTKEFSTEYLRKAFTKRPKIKIGQILTDQAVISGVGNIYANEALFCAGVSPLRPAKDLSQNELAKIKKCIEEVIGASLKYGGSSENQYVKVSGEKGTMQEHFKVYRKLKQPCSKCGGKIKRVPIGGRGLFYCPTCQK